MIAWTIIQFLILLWAIRLLWRRFVANRNKSGLPEPPGPYGLPVVGYLPFLGKNPHIAFVNLGRKYGDIFQVQMGVQKAVVLNSLDVIKEALSKDSAFNGRPDSTSFKTFLDNSHATFSFRTGDDQWKYMRKLAINALSMFATSRNSRLEAVVDEACDEFHAELTTHAANGPFDPQRNIFECVASVIGRAVFGVDFSSKDSLFKTVLALNATFSDFFSAGSVMDSLPFGAFIMRNKINDFVQSIRPLSALVEKQIMEHDVHDEQEDDVRDVADAIALAAKQTPEDVKKQLGLTDIRIRCIVQDLFGAGFSTTMDSLQWATNLLAAFPDIQEKARRELAKVCGNRPVGLNDRSDLPYNEALLLEVFRYSSLAPLSVPHSTMEDTTLRGYFIPKGTTIFPNLFAHHRNAEHFPDPETFNPERFLKSDRSLDMTAAQLVVPFGVGKRRCPGENLARQELSLLIGRLLQHFEIRQDPTDPINVHDTRPGFARGTIQTRLVFKTISV